MQTLKNNFKGLKESFGAAHLGELLVLKHGQLAHALGQVGRVEVWQTNRQVLGEAWRETRNVEVWHGQPIASICFVTVGVDLFDVVGGVVVAAVAAAASVLVRL